jgi:hypothetical protein
MIEGLWEVKIRPRYLLVCLLDACSFEGGSAYKHEV